jgi:hypothetical protein
VKPGDHVDIEAVAERAHRALNVLTKWRSFFAGWQLGTQSDTHGPSKAVKDHREVTILLRAEVSALIGLLIDKRVCTQVEWTQKLGEEAEALNAMYAKRFDGVEATEHGLSYDPARSLETMRSLGFPP